MFTPTAPDGLFLNDEKPELAITTYPRNLGQFFNLLNFRRLHVHMPVSILAERNSSVIASGKVIEIIPPQQFSGETGEYHEAVITVRLADGTIHHYAAGRIIPADAPVIADDMEQEIPTSPVENRHYFTGCDD